MRVFEPYGGADLYGMRFSGGFEFALVYGTTGGDTAISSTGSLLWDNLTLEGKRSIATVFFAGKAIPPALGTPWAWGQSTIGLEEGAGRDSALNALKWVQGNELGNGWTGIGFNIDPPYDMSWSWSFDSLKFWMKAEYGGIGKRAGADFCLFIVSANCMRRIFKQQKTVLFGEKTKGLHVARCPG